MKVISFLCVVIVLYCLSLPMKSVFSPPVVQPSPTVGREDGGIPKKQLGKRVYYDLNDLKQMGLVKGSVNWKQETCSIEKNDDRFVFERNNTVFLHNGYYESIDTPALFLNKTCYLPETVFKKVQSSSKKQPTMEQVVTSYSAKQLANHLSFLRSPIPGSHVSSIDSSLPGAVRAYRNGVHEGLDWYTYGTGKVINTKTAVLSMGSGLVVRSDQNYHEMSTKERNHWLAIGSKNSGQTPDYILDKLRGKTVWIQFENGVMARYCHLSKIPKSIKAGTHVKAGDIVGFVGNTGTSDGALHNNKGLHLHLDILIYGNWLWGNYTVAERRMILESVFNRF
ncbi:M23 family metallopeptidase [Shimazuella kribbensis]|uniref:M23 family metallopeptidase n=1 Tax=Shimazuella kribbensis TaxID=139808 RepID=UPI00040E1EEC|nr:M23 family metallopeptidase [Shimazuella kribbensis]